MIGVVAIRVIEVSEPRKVVGALDVVRIVYEDQSYGSVKVMYLPLSLVPKDLVVGAILTIADQWTSLVNVPDRDWLWASQKLPPKEETQ